MADPARARTYANDHARTEAEHRALMRAYLAGYTAARLELTPLEPEEPA